MSGYQNRSVRHELEPFFGNDGRANLFIKLFIDNVSGNESINENDPDSILNNSFAYQIMVAKDYDANSKNGVRDDDIHTDFINFIGDTGKFHGTVDFEGKNGRGIADPASQLLFNEVYSKWNDLSETAKQFYNRYIIILDMKGETVSPDQIVPNTQYNQYRFNFKTNIISRGISEPLFENMIPNVPTGSRKQNFGVDGLKKIYIREFQTAKNSQWTGPNTSAYFRVNYDSLIRHRLMRLRDLMEKSDEVPTGPLISLSDKNIWQRDPEGRLYMATINGPVYYDEDSPATVNALKANFKCYSTLTRGSEDDCKNYVAQCLINGDSNDLQHCVKYLSNTGNFYDVSKEDISSMTPAVALATLKRLGFRERSEYDSECGQQLRKVESVDHWIRTVLQADDKYTQTTVSGVTLTKAIEKNQKLLSYLQLLTEYVNSNPAILNVGYRGGNTIEAIGVFKPSQLSEQLRIPVKIEPKGPYASIYDYNMLQINLKEGYSSQTLKRNRAGTISNFTSPYSSGVLSFGYPTGAVGVAGVSGFGGVVQNGGNSSINTYFKKMKSNKVTGGQALYLIILNTIDELRNKGVVIPDSDIKQMENQINILNTTESELIKVQIYLEEYKNYIDVFGSNGNEYKSIDEIKQILGKEQSLYNRQQGTENELMNGFRRLHDMLVETKSKRNNYYKPL